MTKPNVVICANRRVKIKQTDITESEAYEITIVDGRSKRGKNANTIFADSCPTLQAFWQKTL